MPDFTLSQWFWVLFTGMPQIWLGVQVVVLICWWVKRHWS